MCRKTFKVKIIGLNMTVKMIPRPAMRHRLLDTKSFNITDQYVPEKHYLIPPLKRVPDLKTLINMKESALIVSPPGFGKTLLIKAAQEELKKNLNYRAVSISYTDTPVTLNPEEICLDIARRIFRSFRFTMVVSKFSEKNAELRARGLGEEVSPNTLGKSILRRPALKPESCLTDVIRMLSAEMAFSLVIFFDNFERCRRSVLAEIFRQLAAGLETRRTIPFAGSVFFLCRHDISMEMTRLVQAAGFRQDLFKYYTEPLAIPAMDAQEINSLYRQHTKAQNQVFTPKALEEILKWTGGCPFLVNAIGRHILEYQPAGKEPIIDEHYVHKAANFLINRRSQSIRSYQDQIMYPPVQNVLESIISGSNWSIWSSRKEVQYCQDLGLVKTNAYEQCTFSNHIYALALMKFLTYDFLKYLQMTKINIAYADRVDISSFLLSYQNFIRFRAKDLAGYIPYKRTRGFLMFLAYITKAFQNNAAIKAFFMTSSESMTVVIFLGTSTYPIKVKFRETYLPESFFTASLKEELDYHEVDEGWIICIDENRDYSSDDDFLTWNRIHFLDGKNIHIVGC
ncbi:MAG: hypothetical protein LBK52_00180 [Deltaproteobacteria bacterium]|nr:hypothetical protein [Deltaproteobacteria bacterium]